jgi:mRNA-degrading endonuclease toxin of MazEF toxin-antitoxin module
MTKAETPKVGQIVFHHFLWAHEQASGQIEGAKARPCIVIAVEASAGSRGPRVTLLPVTSQPPRSAATTIEIPDALKTRVGLDPTLPGWVVIDDANVFTWPGFDLVPLPDGSFIRGMITSGFFQQIATAVLAAHSRRRLHLSERDDK